MKTVAQALKEIVDRNSFLVFGLHRRLLNLSQVARFVQPHVSARLKRSVETSAITMGLSRMQRELGKPGRSQTQEELRIINLTVQSNLAIFLYRRSPESHTAMHRALSRILRQNGYITVTEGISEISVILETRHVPLLRSTIEQRPVRSWPDVASVRITFDSKHIESPGLFHAIFQLLYFQQLNVLEVASTGTELILYLEEGDVQLCFDTIYGAIRRPRGLAARERSR